MDFLCKSKSANRGEASEGRSYTRKERGLCPMEDRDILSVSPTRYGREGWLLLREGSRSGYKTLLIGPAWEESLPAEYESSFTQDKYSEL